jgi:hypothetical protein
MVDVVTLTKQVTIKATLLKFVTLIVLVTCGYAGFQWNQNRLLTARSRAVEEQLIRLLPRTGDRAPIDRLLPSALMSVEGTALVCTVTPYQTPGDIPQLADMNFGRWFDFGGESWIGVVALNAKGVVVTTVRLSRLKLDLLPYTERGRCYRPIASDLVNVGSSQDGVISLAIGTH